MFCRNCGMEIPAGAVFCPGCGTKVETEAVKPDPDGTVLLGGAAFAQQSMQNTVQTAQTVQPRTTYPGQQVFSAVPPAPFEAGGNAKKLKYQGGQLGSVPTEPEEKTGSVPGWLYPVLGIIIGILAAILIWQIIELKNLSGEAPAAGQEAAVLYAEETAELPAAAHFAEAVL